PFLEEAVESEKVGAEEPDRYSGYGEPEVPHADRVVADDIHDVEHMESEEERYEAREKSEEERRAKDDLERAVYMHQSFDGKARHARYFRRHIARPYVRAYELARTEPEEHESEAYAQDDRREWCDLFHIFILLHL